MRPAVLFIALLALPLVGAQTSDSVQLIPARLPDPVEAPAAAYDGHHVYVFGGYIQRNAAVPRMERQDDIVRFDPVTETTTVMGARMDPPRHGMAAAAFGGQIYLFGGFGCLSGSGSYTYCNSILRYDPGADKLTQLDATLPTGLYYTAAAASGDAIYFAGGGNHDYRVRVIWKFDPASETGKEVASLSTGTEAMAAAWANNNLFLFGGQQADKGSPRDWILKFDPATQRLTELPTYLPKPNYGLSAAYDGTYVYLFGGEDYPAELDTIVRFNPVNNAVSLLTAKLPSARFRTSAAWAGEAAYVFGGEVEDANADNSVRLSDIVRFKPAAGGSEPTKDFKRETGKGFHIPGFDPTLVLVGASLALVAFARRRA